MIGEPAGAEEGNLAATAATARGYAAVAKEISVNSGSLFGGIKKTYEKKKNTKKKNSTAKPANNQRAQDSQAD